MSCFLSRCLCSVWLLLFSSVLVFAVAGPDSPRSTLTFSYDGGDEVSAAYDQTAPSGFGYDCGTVLPAHESESRTGLTSSAFAKLSKVLAAKEAGALTYGELRQAGVNLTDRMSGNQFRKLVDSIRETGLQDKVINFVKIGEENYVVLGNNRQ